MQRTPRKSSKISRRKIFSILGGSLLLPIFGFPQSDAQKASDDSEEKYETLLKPDGTTVKVKASTVKKAKVLKKNISNKAFLKWLGKRSNPM